MRATEFIKSKFPDEYEPRILDAHHHFWDITGEVHVPWIAGEYNPDFFLGEYHTIRHTFLPEQYRHATADWNIIGTVHCEAEVDPSQQVTETQLMTKLHEQDSRYPLAAVGHVLFLQEDLIEILDAHSRYPLVRGVRSKPVTAKSASDSVKGEPGTLQDPKWREGLKRLQDYNYSWDLRVPYYHLSESAEVVAEIPDTKVIINHCGLPLNRDAEGLKVWRHGMKDLASLPNTYIKVSELGLAPNVWDHDSNVNVVREVLEIFGYERSMFASNLPVALVTARSFDDIMDVFADATQGASPAQLDALFHKTAAEAYRIDLSQT